MTCGWFPRKFCGVTQRIMLPDGLEEEHSFEPAAVAAV